MPFPACLRLLPAILLSAALNCHAAAPPSAPVAAPDPSDTLSQAKIHDLYNGGDFEPVITVLETYIRNHKTYSHADSVFIAKHLAVVYSANPETREKGKYYMFRLLELLPSAKLVDMYVSEEVDRIFDRVREEFLTRQHAFGVDTSSIDLPDRPRRAQPAVSEGGKSHALLWASIAGGGALLVAGTWVWIANRDGESGPAPQSVDVKVITPKN